MGRPRTRKSNPTMVKINADTKRKLKEKSKKKNMTMIDLLDLLVGDKKGQLSDLAVFLITIFSVVVVVLFSWVASDQIAEGFRSAGFNTTSEQNASIDGIETIGKAGDTIFSIVLFGLTLVLLLSAILIPTNIVFMTIYLIGILFIWILSPILSNTYNSLTSSGVINTAATNLPITNVIMQNLPIYFTVLVMLILLILYGKGRLEI